MNDLLLELLDLPPQASTYARSVDTLHFFVISATMMGAVFVFLLALFYLVRYRRTTPLQTTARVITSTPTEVLIIGAILSLFLAFWAIGATQYNRMFTPPADAIPVYVTAKQWMWKFSYPGGQSSMDTLNVPVNRPIKLVMTSRDVIHSFYVPAFRMKHDVVPGRYYVAWFEATTPGVYDIDCAELCGVGHSRMLGKVNVLTGEQYGRWLEGAPQGDLVSAGRDVALRRACTSCHSLDGQPYVGPSWAGLYGSEVKMSDGRVLRADEEYLTRSMMDPQADLVAGYRPVMPSYRGILAEPEVAALVEFIQSLRTEPIVPAITLPRVNPLSSGEPQEPRP